MTRYIPNSAVAGAGAEEFNGTLESSNPFSGIIKKILERVSRIFASEGKENTSNVTLDNRLEDFLSNFKNNDGGFRKLRAENFKKLEGELGFFINEMTNKVNSGTTLSKFELSALYNIRTFFIGGSYRKNSLPYNEEIRQIKIIELKNHLLGNPDNECVRDDLKKLTSKPKSIFDNSKLSEDNFLRNIEEEIKHFHKENSGKDGFERLLIDFIGRDNIKEIMVEIGEQIEKGQEISVELQILLEALEYRGYSQAKNLLPSINNCKYNIGGEVNKVLDDSEIFAGFSKEKPVSTEEEKIKLEEYSENNKFKIGRYNYSLVSNGNDSFTITRNGQEIGPKNLPRGKNRHAFYRKIEEILGESIYVTNNNGNIKVYTGDNYLGLNTIYKSLTEEGRKIRKAFMPEKGFYGK